MGEDRMSYNLSPSPFHRQAQTPDLQMSQRNALQPQCGTWDTFCKSRGHKTDIPNQIFSNWLSWVSLLCLSLMVLPILTVTVSWPLAPVFRDGCFLAQFISRQGFQKYLNLTLVLKRPLYSPVWPHYSANSHGYSHNQNSTLPLRKKEDTSK